MRRAFLACKYLFFRHIQREWRKDIIKKHLSEGDFREHCSGNPFLFSPIKKEPDSIALNLLDKRLRKLSTTDSSLFTEVPDDQPRDDIAGTPVVEVSTKARFPSQACPSQLTKS
jgi:hypothetical protein